MKTRKVIHHKHLPMRCPLVATLVLWLVLERLDAAGWIWGVIGTFAGLIWLAWVVDVINRQDTEIHL